MYALFYCLGRGLIVVIGGIDVPADGDNAHQFTAPGANDIRGMCLIVLYDYNC